jgi:hypothetical protein
MSTRVVTLLFIAAVSAGTPALAAPPGPHAAAPPTAPVKSKDHADELFDQGTAAVDAGHWADAESKFQEAWALKQTHDIAGNLGIVERHLGKYSEAVERITWALDHWPPTESSAARKALEQELLLARAEVGALRVRVNVDGAEVTVNGRAAGLSPVAAEVVVDPGSVKVAARREGYVAVEQSVTVAKGEAREVALALEPAIVPKQRSVTPGIVLGSVAGAALVSGIALVAVAANKHATDTSLGRAITDANHSCVAGAANFDPRCSTLQNTSSAADTLSRVGVGALVGAGALAAGTVAYFFWPESKPGAPASGRVRLVPAVSTTGGGMFVSGEF